MSKVAVIEPLGDGLAIGCIYSKIVRGFTIIISATALATSLRPEPPSATGAPKSLAFVDL